MAGPIHGYAEAEVAAVAAEIGAVEQHGIDHHRLRPIVGRQVDADAGKC